MTDFHRSLDRAIARDEQDPHTDWGLDSDLPGMWTASDFTGGDPDERSYTERGWITGDDIAEGAGFKSIQTAPDHVFPLRFIAGIDPADVGPADLKIDVMWQIPAPMTITRRYFGAEVLELIFGGSIIPLCDRQLPPEGQE